MKGMECYMSSKKLIQTKQNKGTSPEGGARRPATPRRLSQAQRLQAVRLRLKEGSPIPFLLHFPPKSAVER